MTVNEELKRMWKEMILVSCKEISQHLHGATDTFLGDK